MLFVWKQRELLVVVVMMADEAVVKSQTAGRHSCAFCIDGAVTG
jgi:hypothetical protein